MTKAHTIIYIIICCIVPSGTAQSCGSRLTASSSYWRSIRPRTSGGNYHHNENCVWYISAPDGKGIKLKIYSVNIESASSCQFDGLEVYGGTSTSGPKLAPTICDTGISTTRYLSAPNKIVVRFYTDHSVARGGFDLRYVAVDESACRGYGTTSNSYCSGTSTNRRCSCNTGYETTSSSFMSCQFNSQWGGSITPVSCTKYRCSTGSSSISTSTYRSTCLPGYGLVKRHTNYNCQSDSSWPVIPTTCRKVSCGSVPYVQNSGYIFTRGTRYLDTATYTCLPGYEITRGSGAITCQSNRRWSTPPTCGKVSCGNPLLLENANSVQINGTQYLDSVTYACIPGYEIARGPGTITCQYNRRWSTLPVCSRVNCGSPPPVPNSKATVTGHSYNDTVTYECEAGYEMSGNESIHCQIFEHWTVPPTCSARECPDPPMVDNVVNVPSHEGRIVGDSVEYICLPGYEIVGDSTVECLPTLQWSTLPICDKINCGPPPAVLHAQATVIGYEYNGTVTFECDTGYQLIGSNTITCQSSSFWTIPPHCQGLPCPDTPVVANAENVTSVSVRTVGDSVEYVCLPGYEIAGDATVECLPTLQWATLPSCNKVRCGEPYTVANSNREVSGHYLYDITVYTCLHGYKLYGNSTISCQQDGYWTTPPECHRPACSFPIVVGNSRREISGQFLYDTTVYTCLPGYQLSGNSTIYCQDDGNWTAPPECISFVDGLQDPENQVY